MGTRWNWRLVLCACVFTCITSVATANPIDSGTAFLLSQQHADGSFAGSADIATAEQATGETLHVLDATSSARAVALAFLTPDDVLASPTEYLARRLVAGESHAEILAELMARRSADGGFGAFAGQPSNILDTAYALQALAGQENQAAVGTAISWLVAQQLPLGS